MNYSPDEWTALCSEVERQGGALLPDRCLPRFVSFSVPNSDRTTKAKTCGCREEAMFVVPYDPADNKKARVEMRQRGAGFARVCGVCDAVGAWPIFTHVIDTGDDDA